jgi:ABC-2 type transport system permease protein
MNKFFIVFLHTYMNKLKSKAFIITSVVSVALILLVSNMDLIIAKFDEKEVLSVLVIDETKQITVLLKEQINSKDNEIKLIPYEESENNAAKEVMEGNYDGLLQINVSDENLPIATFKANTVTDANWINDIHQALQQVKIMLATKQLGLNPAEVAKVYEPVPFEKIALEKGAKSEEELDAARGIVYILLFLIYFAVIFYGTMISTEVATEKSSRVMEILISSVSPVTQMFGKIFAIAALGLTQFTLILTAGYIGMKNRPPKENGTVSSFTDFISFDELPVGTVIYALVFFMLGFLLYATLLAVLGSLVNRVEEANQVVTPVIILMVVGFMIAMSGLGNPSTSFIQITSYIPFFSPMIMFLRVGMLDVPIIEIILSIAILIGTTIALAIVGARIYSGGVLMYGNAMSFKNIKKALQLSKK